MSPAAQEKLATLFSLNLQKYTARGDSHPAKAAEFAVADIMNMYKTQMQYIEQLLDEEIEDTLKGLAAA